MLAFSFFSLQITVLITPLRVLHFIGNRWAVPRELGSRPIARYDVAAVVLGVAAPLAAVAAFGVGGGSAAVVAAAVAATTTATRPGSCRRAASGSRRWPRRPRQTAAASPGAAGTGSGRSPHSQPRVGDMAVEAAAGSSSAVAGGTMPGGRSSPPVSFPGGAAAGQGPPSWQRVARSRGASEAEAVAEVAATPNRSSRVARQRRERETARSGSASSWRARGGGDAWGTSWSSGRRRSSCRLPDFCTSPARRR